MNTAASVEPLIQRARVTRDEIIAYLVDGRVISVPLAWSWRLAEASPGQRQKFRIIGHGQGIHWPDLDEDLSIEGMLHGTPAPRPKSSAASSSAGDIQPRKMVPQRASQRRKSATPRKLSRASRD